MSDGRLQRGLGVWAWLALGACGATAVPAADAGVAVAANDAAVSGDAADGGDDVLTPDVIGGFDLVFDIPVDVPKVDVPKYVGKCAKGPGICDDGNPCTDDDCDPALGCLTAVKACADDDVCTLDTCDVKTGECVHSADPCDDLNACTAGSCSPGVGCVFAALDCSDGDACTSDGCTPANGCVHAKLDCDDGKTCTTDSCASTSGCVHSQPASGKCCEADSDCDDSNVCTVEHCLGGLCQSQGVANCCKADADCNDENACTVDACNLGNGACASSVKASAGCCQVDADCNDGKPCTLDRCSQNACAHEVTCCKSASDCALFASAVDACGEATCTSAGCGLMPVKGSGCCASAVKSTDFENPAALSVATSPSTIGAWSVGGGAGAKQLQFIPADKLIPGGGKLAVAKMAAVQLPAGTKTGLSFGYSATMVGGDTLRLRALTGVGNWIIWQTTTSATKTISLDLSGFAGRIGAEVVTLQWEFSATSLQWAGGAAVATVDDLAVTSTCAVPACKTDADCNDGLTATNEGCGNGQCIYSTNAEYCETSASCDDGNLCTSDSCLPSQNKCNHAKVYNCCLDTAECDDKNVCTLDACNSGHQCTHSKLPPTQCCNSVFDCDDKSLCTMDSCPVIGLPCAHTQPDANCCMGAKDCNDAKICTVDSCALNQCSHVDVCCQKDKDCDDGEAICTVDTCVDQFCSHAFTSAPGCCLPMMIKEDMDTAAAFQWSSGGSSANAKWQWSDKKPHTGAGGYWYGNAATGDFSDGNSATNGTITSPPIDLPANNTYEFSLWVWLDTETGPPYDELTLSANVDGQILALWTKHKDQINGVDVWKMQTWYQVKANLSAFAGKTVVLSLRFDTIDSVGNGGQGVYVDELRLVRSCAPFPCNAPTDCDDGLAATFDGCANGQCTYAY